jgi:hypothetical protein
MPTKRCSQPRGACWEEVHLAPPGAVAELGAFGQDTERMTIKRKYLGFGIGLAVFVAAIVCLYLARSDSAPTADLTGHWDGPQGGLDFDASNEHIFQVDIMHTYFFGSWKAAGADSCVLQFYDLSSQPPVFNDPAMLGSARIRRDAGKVFCDLTMPGAGTRTFHHTGPPSERLKDLKFD